MLKWIWNKSITSLLNERTEHFIANVCVISFLCSNTLNRLCLPLIHCVARSTFFMLRMILPPVVFGEQICNFLIWPLCRAEVSGCRINSSAFCNLHKGYTILWVPTANNDTPTILLSHGNHLKVHILHLQLFLCILVTQQEVKHTPTMQTTTLWVYFYFYFWKHKIHPQCSGVMEKKKKQVQYVPF